nr:MAG TPA: hypothetical protein [Caudoviricetes sp.]
MPVGRERGSDPAPQAILRNGGACPWETSSRR